MNFNSNTNNNNGYYFGENVYNNQYKYNNTQPNNPVAQRANNFYTGQSYNYNNFPENQNWMLNNQCFNQEVFPAQNGPQWQQQQQYRLPSLLDYSVFQPRQPCPHPYQSRYPRFSTRGRFNRQYPQRTAENQLAWTRFPRHSRQSTLNNQLAWTRNPQANIEASKEDNQSLTSVGGEKKLMEDDETWSQITELLDLAQGETTKTNSIAEPLNNPNDSEKELLVSLLELPDSQEIKNMSRITQKNELFGSDSSDEEESIAAVQQHIKNFQMDKKSNFLDCGRSTPKPNSDKLPTKKSDKSTPSNKLPAKDNDKSITSRDKLPKENPSNPKTNGQLKDLSQSKSKQSDKKIIIKLSQATSSTPIKWRIPLKSAKDASQSKSVALSSKDKSSKDSTFSSNNKKSVALSQKDKDAKSSTKKNQSNGATTSSNKEKTTNSTKKRSSPVEKDEGNKKIPKLVLKPRKRLLSTDKNRNLASYYYKKRKSTDNKSEPSKVRKLHFKRIYPPLSFSRVTEIPSSQEEMCSPLFRNDFLEFASWQTQELYLHRASVSHPLQIFNDSEIEKNIDPDSVEVKRENLKSEIDDDIQYVSTYPNPDASSSTKNIKTDPIDVANIINIDDDDNVASRNMSIKTDQSIVIDVNAVANNTDNKNITKEEIEYMVKTIADTVLHKVFENRRPSTDDVIVPKPPPPPPPMPNIPTFRPRFSVKSASNLFPIWKPALGRLTRPSCFLRKTPSLLLRATSQQKSNPVTTLVAPTISHQNQNENIMASTIYNIPSADFTKLVELFASYISQMPQSSGRSNLANQSWKSKDCQLSIRLWEDLNRLPIKNLTNLDEAVAYIIEKVYEILRTSSNILNQFTSKDLLFKSMYRLFRADLNIYDSIPITKTLKDRCVAELYIAKGKDMMKNLQGTFTNDNLSILKRQIEFHNSTNLWIWNYQNQQNREVTIRAPLYVHPNAARPQQYTSPVSLNATDQQVEDDPFFDSFLTDDATRIDNFIFAEPVEPNERDGDNNEEDIDVTS